MEKTKNVNISENAFISKACRDDYAIGVLTKNTDKDSLILKKNIFHGFFSEYYSGGITAVNNVFYKPDNNSDTPEK